MAASRQLAVSPVGDRIRLIGPLVRTLLTLWRESAKMAAMNTIARARRILIFALLALCLLAATCQPALAQEDAPRETPSAASPLVWLLPLGVTLAAMGLRHARAAHEAAVALPLAWALGLVGYAASGLALQFGSLGLVSAAPGLESLTAQWSPLAPWLGDGWGLAGLRGFLFPLRQVSAAQGALFLSQAPLVVTATLIPLVTLRGRLPALPQALLALWVAAVAYPLMGHWLRSGGWLSQLGSTLSLGQGAVDAGLGALFLVGGLAALAGLLAFRGLGSESSPSDPEELPEAHLPLYLLGGALLAWIGWLAHIQDDLVVAGGASSQALLNALWAAVGAVLAAAGYGWLIHGEIDAGLVGRGLLAAMVAVAPGAPWLGWQWALLSGALCGALLAPSIYLVERILHCEDRATAVSLFVGPVVWGWLATGLFAQGKVVGWWTGDPVAGLAQFLAQLLGLGALGLIAGVLPWCLLALLAQGYAWRARRSPRAQAAPVTATIRPSRAHARRAHGPAHLRRRTVYQRGPATPVRPVRSRRASRS